MYLVTCPKCEGSGTVTAVVKRMAIGSMYCLLCSGKGRINRDTADLWRKARQYQEDTRNAYLKT